MKKNNFYSLFSFQTWMDQPFMDRYEYKWYLPYLLYKEPFALEWKEWDKFYAYIKEEHPIQYFFRYTLSVYLGKWENRFKDLCYKAKGYFFNPRKRMRDSLFPGHYVDLSYIISEFHFEAIREFVEKDKCFELNAYGEKEGKKFKKQLEAYYKYITVERPVLNKNTYTSDYKFNVKNAKILKNKDKKLCNWVIENKDRFWV